MRWLVALLGVCCFGQNYASYSTYPVARMSFLRHQFDPSKNAFRDPSLQGFWQLNEGAGSVAYDFSGNGFNATWAGTSAGTIGYYSSGKTAAVAGYFLTANSNYAVYGSSIASMSGVNSATLCGWSYYPATSPLFGGFGSSPPSGSSAKRYNIDMGFGGNPIAVVYQSENASASFPYYSYSGITSWSFYCMTIGSSAMKPYINGAQVTLQTGGVAPAISTTNPFSPIYLGTDPQDSFFLTGQLANIRLYNRTLSQAEIQAIYNAENH